MEKQKQQNIYFLQICKIRISKNLLQQIYKPTNQDGINVNNFQRQDKEKIIPSKYIYNINKIIEIESSMNDKNKPQSRIGKPQGPFGVNQQSNVPFQSEIQLTLVIKGFQLMTTELKSMEYKDFLQSLQKEHFPELTWGNQLILAQGWNPVIPQSIDSKIEEVLSCTVPRYTVWKLYDYLLGMAHRQKELQQANNLYFDEIQKNTWKIKYQELELQYNKIQEQYDFLQNSYQKYFEAIDEKKVDRNSTMVVSMNKFTCKLLQDQDAAKQQYQDLTEEHSLQQQQIESLKKFIQNLNQENIDLKNQITQSKGKLEQIPIQQGFNKPEIEQSQNKKSNPKFKIQEVTYDSQKSTNCHQSKESKIDNSDITSICGQCKKSCPEHIVLPCKRRYHEHCFEQLGRQSYVDSQPSVYCICQNKISIKLFKKETQFLLFDHQAALIFQNYHNTYPFSKCKDCEFYYTLKGSTHGGGKAYCPNCLKFIRGS